MKKQIKELKEKVEKEVHFYPLEQGGFEFEVILKEKPITNKIVLINKCYQPLPKFLLIKDYKCTFPFNSGRN